MRNGFGYRLEDHGPPPHVAEPHPRRVSLFLVAIREQLVKRNFCSYRSAHPEPCPGLFHVVLDDDDDMPHDPQPETFEFSGDRS